jgi:hypothetical protein
MKDDLTKFLVDALTLVEGEPQTAAWFALRTSASSYAIVDVFYDEEGRRSHLPGPVAAALTERSEQLFVKSPKIEHVDVLAAKLSVDPRRT